METKFLNELYEMVEELKKDSNKKQLIIKYKEFLPKLVSSIYPVNSVDITRLIMEILNLSIDIDPLTFEANRLVYMIGELTLLLCDARLSLENSSENQIESDLILKLLNSYFLITKKSKTIKIFYDETIQLLYDSLHVLKLLSGASTKKRLTTESFSIHISHYNQFLLPVSSEITRNLDVSSKEKCLSLMAALLKILKSFKKITCSKCISCNSNDLWKVIFMILDEIGSKLTLNNNKESQNNHFISKHEVFVMIHCLRLSSSLLTSSIDIPPIMYNNLFDMIDLTTSIRTEFVLGTQLDGFLLTFVNYASRIFDTTNSNLFKSKFCNSIVNIIKMAEDESLIDPLCSIFSEIIKKIRPSTAMISSLLVYPFISNPKLDKHVVNIICNIILCELEEKSNYTPPQLKKRKSIDNIALTQSDILNHIIQFLNINIHENSDISSLKPLLRILEIALRYKDLFNRKENENSTYFDDIIVSTHLSNLIEYSKNFISKHSLRTEDQYSFFIDFTKLTRKYMVELSKFESSRIEPLNIKILSYFNTLWKFISTTMKNDISHIPNLDECANNLVDQCLCSINWMPYPSYTNNIQKIFKSAIQNSSEMVQICAIKHLPFHFLKHGVNQLKTFMSIIEGLLNRNAYSDIQIYISLFITKIPCIAKYTFPIEEIKSKYINGKITKVYYERIIYENSDVYIPSCNDCSSENSEKDYFIIEPDVLDSYQSNIINEMPSNIFSYKIWKDYINIIYHTSIPPELTAKLLKFSARSIIRHCLVEQLNECSTEETSSYITSELNNQINYLFKYTLNPDYDIRISCAKILSVVIEKKEVKGSSPLNLKIIQEVYKKLETASNEADSYSYYESIIESLLITMRYIACASNGWYILPPLLSMIPFLVHDNLKIRSIVYDQLNVFSKKKNLSMHNIIYGFNGKIYWKLVKQLITNPILVEEAAVALLDQDTESFLRSGLTTLLRNVVIPKIVLSVNDDLLNEISRILKVNPSSLLLDSLESILFSIMVNGYDVQKTNPACKYLYKKLNTRLSTLIERCRSGLLKRIVLLLGNEESRHKGECALEAVINFSSYQRSSSIQSMKGNIVADFLKEHFLELVDEIIHKNILKVNINPSDGTTKTEALLSLNEIIVYVKPYLSNFYLKITASLKLIMDQFPSLRIPACKCYLTLFKNLDARDIAPILGQTVVHLYPFLEDIDEHVAEILKHLIIERQQELYPHFHDIPFIPDKQSLSEIKSVWEKYVQHGFNNGEGLRKQIKELTRLIENESENIRLMSLHQLTIVLSSRRKEINEILLRDTVDPTINSLVEALAKGCRDQNFTVRVKFGEVLGRLGPIDPGILNINIHPDLPELDKKDEQIAQDIIENYLVKAYRSATNVSAQDNAAYAIQEILKCYHCDAKTPLLGSVPDYNLSENQKIAWSFWSRLSNDVRIIIQPFLTSKYAYISNSSSSASMMEMSGSIYKPSMKFNKWLYEWTKKLISDANVQMYMPLACVIKDELEICQYLIPHLVLKIFQEGTTTAKKSILNEILSIINGSQDGEVNQMAVQQIFGLISCLTNYVEKMKRELLTSSGKATKSEIKKKYSETEKILLQIPQSYLAQAALKSNAYARALLHFENSIRYSNKSNSNNSMKELTLSDINMLQQIYLGLDQPDAISGIVSLQTETSPISSIIEYEAECKWDEALMSIEHALQQNLSPEKEQELRLIRLRCLREIGYFDQLLNLVKLSLHEGSSKLSNDLISHGSLAAIRLGQWDLAEDLLKQTKTSDRQINERFSDIDFDISVANLLTDLKKGEYMSFRSRLIKTRKEIMEPLAAASLDSYQRAYPLINRLHILSEINDTWKLLYSNGNLQMSDLSHTNGEISQNTNISNSIISNWDDILKISQPSFKIREPILSIRLVAFELACMPDKLAKTWMQIAKHARTSGRSRMAHYALFKVRELKEPSYYIEKAKLLWSTKQEQAALQELQNLLKNKPIETSHRPAKMKRDLSLSFLAKTTQSNHIDEEEILYNKALLLMTRWMHETGQISHNDIIKQFETVTTRMPHWEKGFFYFGRYFDQLVQEFKKEVYKNRAINESDFVSDNIDVKKPYWDYIPHVIYNYGAAMLRGHKYIYQTMPKILTLWLDAGESLSDIFQSQSSSSHQTKVISGSTIPTKTKGALENALVSNWPLIQGIMRYLIDNLPCHLWISTFPRLVARVNHRNHEVWVLLLKLIVKILGMYPQQSIWHLLPLSQSTNYKRKKYDEIRSKVIDQMHVHGNTKIETIMNEAEYVAKEFLTICNYSVTRDYSNKIISIQKMSDIKSNIPSNLILPTEKQLNEFNLATMVYIRDFGSNVLILQSQQRPKKVRILGSDGRSYDFLCKPKDDLRKDSRMMEFSTMINKLLKKDPEGRRRELIIRTYSVIPLNDDSGIIGWVPNTKGFRNILMNQYALNGISYNEQFRQARELYDNHRRNNFPKIFKERVLPLFKPIFWKWFISNFSEPSRWYRARLAFAHTTAVMSMVGAIVGLGDRHAENIMIDSKTGECVHVDLNCLFMKGLTFKEPEVVPFRLTQNMVDALGITGYEGIFRRVCEITMRTLRNNKESLLSVMETLVHDPLIEWANNSSKNAHGKATDRYNIEALETLKGISDRIDGIKRTPDNKDDVLLPLSIEGHVNSLINDATSIENLAHMYIGWTAFL